MGPTDRRAGDPGRHHESALGAADTVAHGLLSRAAHRGGRGPASNYRPRSQLDPDRLKQEAPAEGTGLSQHERRAALLKAVQLGIAVIFNRVIVDLYSGPDEIS